MLVPVKWLKKYIDIDKTAREIANKVTDSGSHVESINSYEKASGLVVCEIKDIREHENADKLVLVDLYDGDKDITIVTGAKNMSIGDKVVLAKVGAKLPGGIEIKEADLQGVTSPGMLCGYSELGVDENYVDKKSQNGLIILSDDVKVGEDAIKALDLDLETIEFEITPNRPDCLSIIGMAREVAAVFDTKIKEPNIEIDNKEDKYKEYFDGVKIETDKVNRFMTAVVKDVVVKESPQYIKNYLRDAGMRPINNIVDIANFVMLEYGQPMHTYDLDKINGKNLIVRQAKDNEEIKTLDKNIRKLESNDILICDSNNTPIGIAGVMGGSDTEVTKDTNNILIESASFDEESIRKTSKRLNLRSESSSRFEKKIPPKLNEIGLKRFLKLIEETNSGIVIDGIADSIEFNFDKRYIELRNQRSNDLLGLDLSIEESKKYLEDLDLHSEINENILKVEIPYFRDDLQKEVDLIEEIGRLYGFQNIKPKPLVGALSKGVKSDMRNFLDRTREKLYALGFSEILTYSFISNKIYNKLNLDEDDKLRDVIKIINPLGEDFSVMRTTLIGNMLDVIRKNLNNKQNDLRFSEVGNSFVKEDGSNKEVKLMTFSLVGDYDFYYLKDSLIAILDKLNVDSYSFDTEENNNIFHSGRCANLIINNEVIGTLGEVNPIVLENFDIEKRVYIAEINLDRLINYSNELVRYKEVSRYPLVERDIALVVDKKVKSIDIVNNIKENGGEYLKFVKLFDMYDGKQIADDKISLAYKIGFQSNDKTLKDKDTKEAFDNIVEGLNKEFDIDLRS